MKKNRKWLYLPDQQIWLRTEHIVSVQYREEEELSLYAIQTVNTRYSDGKDIEGRDMSKSEVICTDFVNQNDFNVVDAWLQQEMANEEE